MKTNYFTGITFIVLLAGGFLISALSHYKTPRQSEQVAVLLDGRDTAAYETVFDKNLLYKQASIDLWSMSGYILFGEGKEGVLVGKNGWLFTNEEFFYDQNFEKVIETNKTFIAKTAETLQDKSIKLVIVLIPSKARIYGDQLGRYNYPSYWQDQYQLLLDFIAQQNIHVVNLLKIFESSKESNIFLRTDTHWTPLGARIAALATDAVITVKYPYLSWQVTDHKSKKLEEIEHEGDLMRYTLQGKPADILNLRKDRFYKWQTIVVNPQEEDLFADKKLPIVLVGTSYSANKLWNFHGFLKEALGVDILNIADEGRGPFTTMNNYLSSDAFNKSKPRLVIWEIPERYIVRTEVSAKEK